MTYRMFIDDLRFPPQGEEWVLVRCVESAIDYIGEHGMPSFISFDHDLGADAETGQPFETGYDFAKWLCEVDMDFGTLPQDFDFKVHSANPVGKANIESYLRNYLSHR